MEVLKEAIINGVKIKVIRGNITKDNVDAIVNAANKYLSHGGGVALAISYAGGPIIQEESNKIVKKYGPLQTGNAVITTGGNLQAKYVIHTVGPIYGEGDEYNKLKKATNSVLKIASDEKLESISIPAISCGIYGFPKAAGTKLIFETAKEFVQNNQTTLKEIHLIGIDKEIPELFKKAIENG